MRYVLSTMEDTLCTLVVCSEILVDILSSTTHESVQGITNNEQWVK